ncbi:hypothetical protein [Dankookia sp. P2]|uniref:hypothetical protein n=1 Tax=Dankookia sp. P2 TaxID=3423955 RepID=UPI003D674C4A
MADVSDLRVGYAFKSEWFAVDGPKLVRGANVAPGRLDWSDEKRLDVNRADQFADYQLRNGDIVLAMDRPLISGGLKAARVEPQDEGALLVQRVASPMPTGLVDKTFLWHLFNSQFYRSDRQACHWL